MITKVGSAEWQGNLKEGKGTVSMGSGALENQPYGFNTRFEDKAGTNPEELLGAAHASCFAMAYSLMLGEENIEPEKIMARATVYLEKKDDAYEIPQVDLKVSVKADADRGKLKEIAMKAKDDCPISKLINAEINLDFE